MTITVSILAQKGGTRKTTLARALSVSYTNGGWLTLLADMDTHQATATQSNKRRIANEISPAIEVRQFTKPDKVWAVRSDYDIVIIDGAGYASADTAVLAQASDLILIPTGTSVDDLEPSVILAQLLVAQHGIDPDKILFPLTNLGSSKKEISDARERLADRGFLTSPGYLTIKTTFSKAHDAGLAITEVTARGPKKEANDWIRGIIARIDQITA